MIKGPNRKVPSTRVLIIIASLLQIVWGLVPSASKLVISEIPVELYISLRWTISGLIFLAWISLTSGWTRIAKRQSVWVALLGIGGYAIASFGTLYGLKIGGVTNFALMGALNPMLTSVVAIVVLRERPTRLFYVALPLCIMGLLMLVLGKHQVSSWHVALSSSALIIGAAFLEATILVFSKRLKTHFSSIQYLTISQLSAAVFMWMLQIGVYQQWNALHDLTLQGWGAAIFVSVVACVLCYSILYWLLNYIDGHRLALFDGLHTISATLFGVLFFNESLNTFMVLGGGLLLTGLILGNLPRSRERLVPSPAGDR